VVSVPVGVELNFVSQGDMGTYWWGVHIYRIVQKEAELMVEVERQDLSSSACPQL
jgi:hypothetical protein